MAFPRGRLFMFLLAGLLATGWLPATGTGGEKPPVRPLDRLSLPQLRVFLRGFAGDWRRDTDESRGQPPPPAAKPAPPGEVKHDLVPAAELKPRSLTLADAIRQRRSHREYLESPLTLEQLSLLLWHTQGVTGVRHQPDGTKSNLRAAPSAGARYPLETYVFAHRVEGLATGLYRFDPDNHCLWQIRLDDGIAGELQRVCFGATFVGEAAVVLAFTTIPYRMEWRYGYIAHRMIAMEAGHAAQNAYLSAAAIGAGACAVAAYHQPSLDRLLGVDGEDEFALYLVTVGLIKDEVGNRENGQ